MEKMGRDVLRGGGNWQAFRTIGKNEKISDKIKGNKSRNPLREASPLFGGDGSDLTCGRKGLEESGRDAGKGVRSLDAGDVSLGKRVSNLTQ